eukprot:Awhi_evm1s12746
MSLKKVGRREGEKRVTIVNIPEGTRGNNEGKSEWKTQGSNEDASDKQNYGSMFKVLVEDKVVSYTNLSRSYPICHEWDDVFSADELSKICLKLKRIM